MRTVPFGDTWTPVRAVAVCAVIASATIGLSAGQQQDPAAAAKAAGRLEFLMTRTIGSGKYSVPLLPTPPTPPGTDPEVSVKLLKSTLGIASASKLAVVVVAKGSTTSAPVLKALTLEIRSDQGKLLYATGPSCVGCGTPLAGAPAAGQVFVLDPAGAQGAQKYFVTGNVVNVRASGDVSTVQFANRADIERK
jgi:hypothetical protein